MKLSLASRTDLEPSCSAKHDAYEKLSSSVVAGQERLLLSCPEWEKGLPLLALQAALIKGCCFTPTSLVLPSTGDVQGDAAVPRWRWGGARTQGVSLQFMVMLNIRGHQARPTNCCQLSKGGMVKWGSDYQDEQICQWEDFLICCFNSWISGLAFQLSFLEDGFYSCVTFNMFVLENLCVSYSSVTDPGGEGSHRQWSWSWFDLMDDWKGFGELLFQIFCVMFCWKFD